MRDIARKSTLLIVLLLVACSPILGQDVTLVPSPTPVIAMTSASTPLPGNLDTITFIDDDTQYTIRQLIPRDGIRPIYEPQFVAADEATYDLEELVMGVEINSDARAYPVGLLQSREMLNDVIGGTPVLVTW